MKHSLHIGTLHVVCTSVLLLMSVEVVAQTTVPPRWLNGQIVDFVTNHPVDGAHMELLRKDSSLVDSQTVRLSPVGYQQKAVFLQMVQQPGEYILHLVHPDYQPLYMPLSVRFYKREQNINLGRIPLKRHMGPLTVNLDGVVVKATKIKFYFSNDTLVYDAPLFTTQQGSVLNDILSKMPGLEIQANGEIYANGRKVDALLLNGKDFFDSDRKTLLENLPAFMVKDIALYDKTKDTLSLLRREREFEGYVMNVRLKKQYASATLANADIGWGTNHRYYNKLFGMKYNACGRISTYAILNNINRNEQLDRYGNSQNLSNGNGDNVLDKWGLAYNYDHPRGTYSVDGTADIAYGDTYTNTKTASTAFLQGGNIYSRVLNTNNLYSVDASTRHRFYFFGNSKYDFSISPSVHYKTNHGNLSMLSATFNTDVDSLLGKAWVDSLRMKNPCMALLQHGIIRQIQRRKNEGYLLEADIRADKDIAIPHTEDNLHLAASFRYAESDDKRFSQQRINHLVQGTTHWNNLYSRAKDYNRQACADANYTCVLNDMNSFRMDYSYDYQSQNNSLPYYALHFLEGWGEDSPVALGSLPAAALMLSVKDLVNSASYASRSHTHKLSFGHTYERRAALNYTKVEWGIPLRSEHKKMHYVQGMTDTVVRRSLFCPDISINMVHQHRSLNRTLNHYTISYNLTNQMPALHNLINVQNDADPLFVTHGNPDLKNSTTHHWNALWLWQTPRMDSHRLSLNYMLRLNAISNALVYDRETGVSQLTPLNVNGNWTFDLGLQNRVSLKKDRTAGLNNNLSFVWARNADYVSTRPDAVLNKSIVHNFTLNERLGVDVSSPQSKWRASAYAYVIYSHMSSRHEDFTNLDTYNYGVQCSLNVELLHNLQLETSLVSIGIRGFNASDMNVDEYIWSANVKKMFGERWGLNLEVFDILGQRKDVYTFVNGQGRSEYFSNNLKRYAMLHILFKLVPRR